MGEKELVGENCSGKFKVANSGNTILYGQQSEIIIYHLLITPKQLEIITDYLTKKPKHQFHCSYKYEKKRKVVFVEIKVHC